MGKPPKSRPRYLKCAVLGCDANSRDYPQLRFFFFPKSDTLYYQWIEAVKNPICHTFSASKVRSRYRVCSRHFTDFQFQTIERRKLNRNQVPSIIDPFLRVFETSACHDELFIKEEILVTEPCNILESEPCEMLDHDYRKPRSSPTTTTSLRLSSPTTSSDLTSLLDMTAQDLENISSIYAPARLRRPSPFTPLERKLKAELRRVKHDYAGLKRRCLKRTALLREFRAKFKKFDLIDMIQKNEIKQLENLSEIAELFFISQIRNISKKSYGRRYTPEELEFFTALFQKGPAAYRFLEKFFALPSASTLKRAERVVIEHNYGIDAGCVMEIMEHADNVIIATENQPNLTEPIIVNNF